MPNRDNAHVLELVLERLALHTTYADVELVVVDDGSSDASLEILRRWRDSGRFAAFTLLEREHGGVVNALNAGLDVATGELVVQLDADASVETPGWLERMVAFFVSDPLVGAVTAKVVFDHGEIHACGIEVIGPFGLHDGGSEPTEPAGRRTSHQRVLRFRDGHCPPCERAHEVDGGIGCCLMYRRADALAVGGYDAGFSPVWFDDLDLTLSLRRRGLKVFFTPEVRVVHHLGRRRKPPVQRTLAAGRSIARAALPTLGADRVIRALALDCPPRAHRERLAHHFDYWHQKWGFDLLNPDMEAVQEQWGHTELWWRQDPDRRAAGRQVVAAHEARVARRS